MFEGTILRWRTRIDALVKCGVWGAIATVALLVALSFFGAAVFVVAQAEFGTIRTLLGFAGCFLAVALLAAIGLTVARRKRQSWIAQTAASAAAPWWLDARLLAAGLDFGKTRGGTPHHRDRIGVRISCRPVVKPERRSKVIVSGSARRRVQRFDTFTPDNDPYFEHDFGSFEHAGKTVFWKLDYFDRDRRYGSPDPYVGRLRRKRPDPPNERS